MDLKHLQTVLEETFAANFVAYYRAHVAHVNLIGNDFPARHKLLQKVYGFTLLSIDWDDIVNKVYDTVAWTKGRDGAHFGVEWHQQMAYDFYLQYSNPEDFMLKYTDPKQYWKKYKDKDLK